MKRINLSKKIRQSIAERQHNKCANFPGSNSHNLKNYQCSLWIHNNGYFRDNNYEIDHIMEYADGGSNGHNNLQALCLDCHATKTKKYMAERHMKVTYSCNKCNYSTTILSNYKSHLKRKTPCNKPKLKNDKMILDKNY